MNNQGLIFKSTVSSLAMACVLMPVCNSSSNAQTPATPEYINHMNIEYYVSSNDAPKTYSGKLPLSDIDICNEDGITCMADSYVPNKFESTLTCVGGNSDGGWEANNVVTDITTNTGISGSNQCWQQLTICFGDDQTGCITYDHSEHDIEDFPTGHIVFKSISPNTALELNNNFSYCGANNPNAHKEYCVWEKINSDAESPSQSAALSYRYATSPTASTPSIDESTSADLTKFHGATGDDMFRLPNNQESIVEYIDIDGSDAAGVIHIIRSGSETKDIMVPAGPLDAVTSINSADDYKNFVTHVKAGDFSEISIYNACFPAQASIQCDTGPIVIDGVCGEHDGKAVYAGSENNLSVENYCEVGLTTNVSTNGNTKSWSCSGYGDGHEVANCSIAIVQPTSTPTNDDSTPTYGNNNDDNDSGNSGGSNNDDNDEYADVDGDGDGDMSIGEAESQDLDYDVEDNYNGNDGDDSGGGGDDSVVCTYFYQKGMLSTRDWRSNWVYTQRHIPQEVVDGYHVWAVPYVRLMRKSELAEKIMFPIMEAWTQERAYQMGHRDKPNYAGKVVRAILEPLCFAIGSFSGQQDYKSLYRKQKA